MSRATTPFRARARRADPSALGALARPALACLCAVVLHGCGGGGSDDDAGADPADALGGSQAATGGRWTVDGTGYVGGNDARNSGAFDEGTPFAVLVSSTTGLDAQDDAPSGSAMTLSYTLDGPGTYRVVPQLGAAATNGEPRVVQVAVTVGTIDVAPLAAVQYVGESGTVEVEVDADGLYSFSTDDPITATQGVVLGEGVPGAPATVDVALDGVGSPVR